MNALSLKNNTFRLIAIMFASIFVLSFLFLLSAHRNDPDEGIILHTAWRFWNGDKNIYTDKFVEYLAPGSGLLVFAFWKLFGQASLAYAKLFVFITWLFSTLGIFLIINRYTKKIFLILLTLLLWTFSTGFSSQINHNPLSSMVAVWPLYLVLLLLDNYSKKINLLLASILGLAIALVLWFLQTKGVALFLFMAVALFLNKKIKKTLLLYYSISFIICSLLLLSITGLKKTLLALFWLPFTLNYMSVNKLQPSLIAIILSITILSSMFFVSIRRKRSNYLAISFFQLALFLSTANNFNNVHFIMNIFPSIIFYIIYFSDNSAFLNRSLAGILNYALVAGSIILITYISIQNLRGPNIFKNNTLDEFNTPQIARAKNIYAGPFLAGFYYEARKTSFYSLSHTDVSNPYYQNLMLEEVKTKKPEIAFLDYEIIAKSLRYNADNPLDNYFKSNYQLCPNKIFKTTSVYVLDKSFCSK